MNIPRVGHGGGRKAAFLMLQNLEHFTSRDSGRLVFIPEHLIVNEVFFLK